MIKITCQTTQKSPINESELVFPEVLQTVPFVGDCILGYVDTKVRNVKREAIEFKIVKITHTTLIVYLTLELFTN